LTLRSAEPSKPNIVVFLADDMGWGDSATYGHKLIQTPNLDKLASQGPEDRTIDGVSMLPAFAGKPVERKIQLFWRTHVSPPNDRVALRIGDWKLVGNDTLTESQLYEIQKDWKEENDLSAEMPERTEEMKNILFKLWADIESEGPDQW
jgi:arylsulfatase A-like enzyme